MAAPIAHFDDDWPHLGDLNMVSEQELLPRKGRSAAAAAAASGEAAAAAAQLLLDDDDEDELHDNSLSPGEPGAFRSMEDLVNDFDEKLSACFQNFNAKTDSIGPVSVISEDTLLGKDE